MKSTAASRIVSGRKMPESVHRPREEWEAERDPWEEETNDWEPENGPWDDDVDNWDSGSDPWEEGESPWDSEREYPGDEEETPWDDEREYRGRQTTAKEVWGIASAVDIYDCDPGKIRDADEIRRFTAELCDLIEMKRFGETRVVHFGEDEKVAGYSMVQLIETSLVSAHFANLTNTVYLDVFSCKPYDPEKVRGFARSFFKGGKSNLSVTMRY